MGKGFNLKLTPLITYERLKVKKYFSALNLGNIKKRLQGLEKKVDKSTTT